MRLAEWVAVNGGIVHREAAALAGYGAAAVRAASRAGAVEIVRRSWVATSDAPAELRLAAAAGGRIACVSAARHREWWVPHDVDARVHLRLAPHAASDGIPPDFAGIVHWTKAVAPAPRHQLLESVEDSLAHIAACLDRETALVLWESAVKVERLDVEALRAIRWPSRAAHACAHETQGLSDSGLETIFVTRLRHWGIPIVQQVYIAGRPVDALIGKRLVVQIDGYAHHSSSDRKSVV